MLLAGLIEKKEMLVRLLVRLIVCVILVSVFAFGVLFTLQNDALVPLDLLIVQLNEQWLALWLLLAFAIGGGAGLLVGLMGLMGLKRDQLSLKRQLKGANKELDALKGSSSTGVKA